jgi:hypothetical protein
MFSRFSLPRFKKSSPAQNVAKKPIAPQPRNSLAGLPLEVFQEILEWLIANRDQRQLTRDLLHLSSTCQVLHFWLSNEMIYERVGLYTKSQATQFHKVVCRGDNAKYVRHLTVVHPTASLNTDDIAGYASPRAERSWDEIILAVISKLPNLESLTLDEISPRFQFTTSKHMLSKSKHGVTKLYLSSESGWNIAARPELLAPFESLELLYLRNMVISPSQYRSRPLSCNTLVLYGCKLDDRVPLSQMVPNLSTLRVDSHLFMQYATYWCDLEYLIIGGSLGAAGRAISCFDCKWRIETWITTDYSQFCSSLGDYLELYNLQNLTLYIGTALIKKDGIENVLQSLLNVIHDHPNSRNLRSVTLVTQTPYSSCTSIMSGQLATKLEFKLTIKDLEGIFIYESLH